MPAFVPGSGNLSGISRHNHRAPSAAPSALDIKEVRHLEITFNQEGEAYPINLTIVVEDGVEHVGSIDLGEIHWEFNPNPYFSQSERWWHDWLLSQPSEFNSDDLEDWQFNRFCSLWDD